MTACLSILRVASRCTRARFAATFVVAVTIVGTSCNPVPEATGDSGNTGDPVDTGNSGGAATSLPGRAAVHVVVVGWDGASPRVVQDLVARGELPALRSLIDRGSYAELRTLRPTHSPAIWTTVATGVLPTKHGIRSFWYRDAGKTRLFDSTHRKAAALWNMASDRGKTVDVVGWWKTWPAEKIAGTMVSDRYLFNRDSHIAQLFEVELDKTPDTVARTIEPAQKESELASCVLSPEELKVRRQQHWKALPQDQLDTLRRFLAQDETYHCMVRRLIKERLPDLLLYYNEGTDVAGHRFWGYRFPGDWVRKYREPLPEQLTAPFARVLEDVYKRQDEHLQDLIDRFPRNTVFIVLSDHGMAIGKGVSGRWTGKHNKAPPGILVLAGPGVIPGSKPLDPSVADITPTVLALMGLPTAADMDGRILREVLETQLQSNAPAPISSYLLRDREHPKASDAVRIEELRSLGYGE